MANFIIVQEWLQKGESDFHFALDSLKRTTYFDQICFLFQQAAEKYLKAVIVAHELSFRKIHDLGVLIEIIQVRFPDFSSLKADGDFLTGFYVETRYPDFPALSATRELALRAKEASERIGNLSKKYLTPPSDPS